MVYASDSSLGSIFHLRPDQKRRVWLHKNMNSRLRFSVFSSVTKGVDLNIHALPVALGNKNAIAININGVYFVNVNFKY